MKKLFVGAALTLMFLGLSAAPIGAAPWCADYCDCSTPCWAQCYDEGGSSACALYICECGGLAAAAADPDELLRAIFVPQIEAPEATEAAAGTCSLR
jgi:hypothetical protein